MEPVAARLLQRLLRRVASVEVADAAIGDLLEGRSFERSSVGRSRAAVRFWRRAFSLCFAYSRVPLRRARRRAATGGSPRVWLPVLGQDLVRAGRTLVASPGATVPAVLTIALGIGANTAVFAVVDAVLLSELPFPEPEQLVEVWHDAGATGPIPGVPSAALEGLRGDPSLFAAAEGWNTGFRLLTGLEEPEQIVVARVTPGLLPMLGAAPRIGRSPSGGEPGDATAAVLTHGFWAARMAADEAVIGSTIVIDDRSHTIVGVMPASFRFPTPDTAVLVLAGDDDELSVVARLHSDVSRETVDARLAAPIQRLREGAVLAPEGRLVAWPLRESYLFSVPTSVRRALWVVQIAVGLVLLTACANLANLRLARALDRERELAVAAALGAGTWRLLRQSLLESALLALAGGGAGVLAVAATINALLRLAPSELDFLATYPIAVDARVAIVSLAASLAIGALAAAAGHRRVRSDRLAESLATGSQTASASRSQRRRRVLLVQAQVALSCVLLVGAGLLAKSFSSLQDVDPGFDMDDLVVAELALAEARFPDAVARQIALRELLAAARRVPGTIAATAANGLPPRLGSLTSLNRAEAEGEPAVVDEFTAADRVSTAATVLFLNVTHVAPTYFDALKIELVQGRRATREAFAAGRSDAVVISESLATRFWRDRSPLGRRIRLRAGRPWLTVVGVAADVKQTGYNEGDRMEMYRPLTAMSDRRSFFQVAVRFGARAPDGAAALRAALRAVQPDAPILRVASMRELFSADLARERFNTVLMSTMAAIAALVAGLGLYSAMTFAVVSARRELGIRVALGAEPRRLVGRVLGDGLVHATVGLVAGGLIAAWMWQLLRGLLFDVEAADAGVFAVVAVGVLAFAALACAWPARRAVQVDPLEVLRAE